MRSTNSPPGSGFRLTAIHCYKQAQTPAPPNKVLGRQREIGVAWDWRRGPENQIQVKLSVEIGPSHRARESLSVGLVASFSTRGKTTLPVERFVRTNAVAIMLPYAREALSNLSSRGFHGAYYLPSINVVELMKLFDFDKATGARQVPRGKRANAAPRA